MKYEIKYSYKDGSEFPFRADCKKLDVGDMSRYSFEEAREGVLHEIKTRDIENRRHEKNSLVIPPQEVINL